MQAAVDGRPLFRSQIMADDANATGRCGDRCCEQGRPGSPGANLTMVWQIQLSHRQVTAVPATGGQVQLSPHVQFAPQAQVGWQVQSVVWSMSVM